MKALLIDLGNTALKWAMLGKERSPETLVHRGVPSTLAGLYKLWLEEKPDVVIGCTVAAPELAFVATKFFNSHGIPWQWVHSTPRFESSAFTLKNKYRNPLQLGADRWCAAIGAVDSTPADAVLVVQMGTATTVDAIVSDGVGSYSFLGGRIAPGPTMMQQSLVKGTAGLPSDIGIWQSVPNATKDAIITGILDAQSGLVRLALDELGAIVPKNKEVKVVLAGGSAKFVSERMKQVVSQVELRHNLVLLGLAALARIHNENHVDRFGGASSCASC